MTRRTKKTGFTREAHFELGLKLARMEATLHDTILSASHVYTAAGPELRALERASRAIERLRSVMDDAICREQPLTDLAVIDAYYPRQT
jgi:hypothetical protein